MPGQKRRYNVRFPPSRIKKIMQKDAEVGRIAMAVPVIISRALEMFLKSLLTKTFLITQAKLSTVVSLTHMKQCIEAEKLFHFLKDTVERTAATAAQKDNRGMSMWPLYRTKRLDVPVKKTADVAEKAPRQSLDSLDNDSSSSESELYICL
ncbi:dr1-associated corepressor [Scomber japonicus]|uniref:dr1-associated corepressor n=1 Tax=Scomber japonicus TaxID=13676 RepID=UPI002304E852|nr:dr1-associated corepressor [Scomber japonicus]